MTRSPTRPPHLSTSTFQVRHRTRVTSTVLAGLAVGTAALAILPGTEPSTTRVGAAASTPVKISGQGAAGPFSLRAWPTSPPPRASRGGGRTALPPVRHVTKIVAVGASFSGNASWYGGSLQGSATASGERFDTDTLTAASRTLPFGTRLRVCRQNACVIVRINDRGPYIDGRILDLSRAASQAIGYDGVAYVTATPVASQTITVAPPARPVVISSSVVAAPTVVALPPLVQPNVDPVARTSTNDTPAPVLAVALVMLGVGGVRLARRRRF